MAVRKSVKKAATRKAGPKKRTGQPQTPTDEKPATQSEPAAASRAGKGGRASKPAKSEKKPKGDVSSMSVNRGHVFSLRPRVSTSFRQADFLTARHLLQDEAYADIEEATRAVVEKALEMTREGPPKRGFKPGR